MVPSRSSALRALARANVVRSTLRSSGPRQLQRIARRSYADGGHHTQAKSNDLTWGLVATALTVPGTWYLLQPGADAHHGDVTGHDKEEPEEEPTDEAEDAPKDGGSDEEQQHDDGEQQGGDEQKASESDAKGDGENTESNSDDGQDAQAADKNEGTSGDEEQVVRQDSKGSSPEGVRFKGKTNQGDEDNEMTDTKKLIPDAKGGTKKRLDSGSAISQSVEDHESVMSSSKMAQQQSGLSTTETKHSTDIKNSPEKSKKGEGTPETAKTSGTVRVDRPQR